MSSLYEHRGRAYLSLSYNCRHLVEEAAVEARRLMDAAKELDGVSPVAPLPGWAGGDETERDRWWTTVFGDTEQELEEQKDALARRYQQIPWWRRKDRAAVLRSYIRVYQMLTAGHGLQTVWR